MRKHLYYTLKDVRLKAGFPYLAFPAVYKKSQIVGIEFELEGAGLPSQQDLKMYWEKKADGSLRGEAAEYVLKTPNAVDYFKNKSLPYLLDAFNKKGTKFNISSRCSTHVHLSMHDVRIYQIVIILTIYGIIEDLLWPLLGEHRKTNLFCLPMANEDLIDCYQLYFNNTENNKPHKLNNQLKYSAVNILPLSNFGTLEFRGMEGTVDYNRVTKWVDILCAIRNYAVGLSVKQAADLMQNISLQGPSAFIQQILGAENAYSIFNANSLNMKVIDDKLYEGVTRMQPFYFSIRWGKIEEDAKEVERLYKPEKSKYEFNTLMKDSYNIIANANVNRGPAEDVGEVDNLNLDRPF